MKTIILYATKYGAAAAIARQIAEQIDGAIVYDLKLDGTPPLAGFDCVIVGSSVYAGMMRKEAKSFLSQHADVLREKKLGLFISGLDESRETEMFRSNVPSDVLQAAKTAKFLGGIFDPQKAGFLERTAMKAITKQSEYKNTIDSDKVRQFAEEMMA